MKTKAKAKENQKGITLIALVITIIVLLILASVSIAMLTGDNGILKRAGDAKIETALGAVKEQIGLYQIEKKMDNKEVTPENLLAEGKVSRTVQLGEADKYYMYYALKENSFEGMQGLGKGNIASLKDVFLIDDNLNIKYISSNGKEYGDTLNNKVLEDETEIRFSSKAFSEYVSKISGVTEEEMKFKWMKNQTSLNITDPNIDSLQDLVFFPKLKLLELSSINLKNLIGLENCKLLNTIRITNCNIQDFSIIENLQNLNTFYNYGSSNADELVEKLKKCNNLKSLSVRLTKINDIKQISELKNLEKLFLDYNWTTKIEGIEGLAKLKTLQINQNNIGSIKDIIKNTNIETLTLTNCGVQNIEGIEKLVNLKSLNLSSNNIIDITPLENNERLTYLNLKANVNLKNNNFTQEEQEKISKIGKILDRGGRIELDSNKLNLFKNYTKLDLSYQGLKTLECLEGMTNLKNLNLMGNQLTLEDEKSREILASMTKLEGLDIRDNKITNMTALNNMKDIQYIYASIGNDFNLKDIENIISKIRLSIPDKVFKTIQNCEINKITKIEIFDVSSCPNMNKFTNLKEIILNGQITNLEIIENVPNVEKISITWGDFSQTIPVDFSKFSKLESLILDFNYISSNSLKNLSLPLTLKMLNLKNNSIIDATALLELNSNIIIYLNNNVNLSQESKDKLKARFGNNVKF